MAVSEYKLIDSGDFKRLEQVGPYCLVRPCLGALWPQAAQASRWQNSQAEFVRDSSGNGQWQNSKLPERWTIKWNELELIVKPTRFGHLGLFPEHQYIWKRSQELIAANPTNSPLKVLNLFAYTGGASLACASKGAQITHVDGSKASVNWAKENAKASGLEDAPIRWIIDDVSQFVKKEVRRGNKYHGVILDPPSYGRGPKNQMWKIEEHLVPLIKDIKELLEPEYNFVVLSSHSQGHTPVALKNLVSGLLSHTDIECGELTIQDNQGIALPSGNYCLNLKHS